MNQSNSFKKKGLILSLLFVLALMVLLSTTAQTVGQNQQTDSQQTEVTEAVEAESGGGLTVWNIIQMTDWLFWPFVVLTASGLMLLTFRSLLEYREKSRSQSLMRQLAHVRDMKSLARSIQTSRPNRASRLLKQMIATFNKTGRAEPIREDASQFLNSERESFQTFNSVLSFLSDTAGALGLLGTVWGIFETFHGGKLDGPTILRGMSISLVTTLVGLIISLVLNFGVTTVFALFNKHINSLSARAEEVRQALLNLEMRASGVRTKPASARPPQPQPEVVHMEESTLRNDDHNDMVF